MKFDNCLFSKNKAVRHGGAIAIQTIGAVEITNCIFEENIANYKPSSSSRMLEEPNNYFDLKEEGRGGAIYINPWFSYKDLGSQANNFLKSIKIENCQFTSNSAFDGFAIYIEGDDPGTIFTIQNNNFTNNYDQTENSQNRGVIITEIERLLKEPIVKSNTFNPYPNNYNIYPIIFVNHSARTPEPTPLPTPMATPNAEVFDTNNCNPRCYHVHEEETSYILFHLPDYKFENLINDSVSGSAVYLENTGLNVTRSSFTNCQSPNHGGGAIYIDNTLHFLSVVNIELTNFTQCKSTYGGAVYVRSCHVDCPVTIKYCYFQLNEIVPKTTSENNDLFGGSAIFLTVLSGDILNCTFKKNIGIGGGVKIYNKFDTNTLKRTLFDKIVNRRNSFLIADCNFENQGEIQSASIYYHGDKSGTEIEIKNCIFKGSLGKDTYYIDGKQVGKDSIKLNVKNCMFFDNYKKSLNFEGNYLSINLKDQVFNFESDQNELKSESSDSFNPYNIIVLAITALLVIIIIWFVVRKSNQNDQ